MCMQASVPESLLFLNLPCYAASACFFVESCLFSVDLSCICYYMFDNLQCKGRAITNVVGTCGPNSLLYYKSNKIFLN